MKLAKEQALRQDVPQAFRGAMRRLAATVSIVTCADEDGWHGMAATAVTSVCADPASVLVCVNNTASLHRRLQSGGRFCLNLLRSSQADLSRIFGGRARAAERFASGDWQAEEGSMPFLGDAQANLFCTIDQVFQYGTHSIFIGRVDGVRFVEEVAPLIYQDGRYASTTLLIEAVV